MHTKKQSLLLIRLSKRSVFISFEPSNIMWNIGVFRLNQIAILKYYRGEEMCAKFSNFREKKNRSPCYARRRVSCSLVLCTSEEDIICKRIHWEIKKRKKMTKSNKWKYQLAFAVDRDKIVSLKLFCPSPRGRILQCQLRCIVNILKKHQRINCDR